MRLIRNFIAFFILPVFFSFPSMGQQLPCNDSLYLFKDTTIVLGNGTELTFNRCEFFEIRDCLEMIEVRNVADIDRNELPMMDQNGEVLLTCGMLIISLNKSSECAELKPKECFDYPIKVRIPILANPCMGSSLSPNELYRFGSSGFWEKIEGGKEVTGRNLQKYLEFYTNCPGRFNCDKRLNTCSVKFKSKKYKEIKFLKETSGCPPLSLTFYPKKRKNIVRAKVPCFNPDSLFITVVRVNDSNINDSIRKPLSHFTSRFTKSCCPIISKTTKRRILGLFPLFERKVYRKYLID